jgi:hypothetical protein
MTYELYVGGVDGETHFNLSTPNRAAIRQALFQHDHEGSAVTLTVLAEDADAYKVLDALDKARPED